MTEYSRTLIEECCAGAVVGRLWTLVQRHVGVRLLGDALAAEQVGPLIPIANAPPSLRGEGAKVHHPWFYSFVHEVQMLRPWLQVMPLSLSPLLKHPFPVLPLPGYVRRLEFRMAS